MIKLNNKYQIRGTCLTAIPISKYINDSWQEVYECKVMFMCPSKTYLYFGRELLEMEGGDE